MVFGSIGSQTKLGLRKKYSSLMIGGFADVVQRRISSRGVKCHGVWNYRRSVDSGSESRNMLPFECRTEDACAVVPEPETYALLPTGLVGVFGMGWLRRCKEKENTLTEA